MLAKQCKELSISDSDDKQKRKEHHRTERSLKDATLITKILLKNPRRAATRTGNKRAAHLRRKTQMVKAERRQGREGHTTWGERSK